MGTEVVKNIKLLLSVRMIPGVGDGRNSRLTLLLFILQVFMSVNVVASDHDATETGVVERIIRRQIDIYFVIVSNTSTRCEKEKNTYLIGENQCVEDKELLQRCQHPLVPALSTHPISVAVFDNPTLNVTYLGNSSKEMFKFNETNQRVNGSICNISSLEVYRGREQAIEISHEGFSLTDSRNIKITMDELAYKLEDYVGELYRMNLSCFGGGLPENGCLYFKGREWRGQESGYVVSAKFNCSVPGTLHNFSQDCNVSTTPTTPTKITTDQSTVSTSITSTADGKSASDADAVVPVYVVAGAAAGGVFILTLCIISTSLCTFLGLRMAKRRQQFALTVYSQQNMHTVDDEQTQEVEHERAKDEEYPMASRTNIQSDLSVIFSDDAYHIYAVLEQTQPTAFSETTEENQQSHDEVDTIPKTETQLQDAIGQPEQKFRSATWTSSRQFTVRPEQRNVNPVIYDNVTVKDEGEVTVVGRGGGPNLHTSSYRKQSLPDHFSKNPHTASNVLQNYTGLPSGSETKHSESFPVYSIPDMKKKRDEHRKREEQKEREERMQEASRKISSSSCAPLLEREEIDQKIELPPAIESGAIMGVEEQHQIDAYLDIERQFGKHCYDDKVFIGIGEYFYDTPCTNFRPGPNKN